MRLKATDNYLIRRAYTRRLLDKVFTLRYKAYREEGVIPEQMGEYFSDKFDEQPNHINWALTLNDRVIGSIRTTWYDPQNPSILVPEQEGYPEDVQDILMPGCRVLSGNRFVVDPDFKNLGRTCTFLLLRVHMLVAERRADVALAAVRKNHLAFYRRFLHLERISEGRPYPGLQSVMYLTACRFQENISVVYESTPSLKPKGYERILLDEDYKDVWEVGLPIEL